MRPVLAPPFRTIKKARLPTTARNQHATLAFNHIIGSELALNVAASADVLVSAVFAPWQCYTRESTLLEKIMESGTQEPTS